MSSLLYKHSIGGNGVAAGLPLRRASQLYDVEPNRRYPLVLSLGTDSDMHTYDRGIYRRVPNLPITFILEPYIANHRAGGGNFTRRQYFVIKRGQPLMAATKRDATIGMFESGGSVTSKTFVDPAKLETDGTITGFTDGDLTGWYRLASGNDTAANPDGVITLAVYNALPAGPTASVTDKTDYEVIADGVMTVAEYDALDAALKEGFRAVVTGVTDTNDTIATGGVNRFAEFDEAIFGSSTLIKYVEVDADSFYFGGATRSEGFIFPSTGGAPRTVFFNEVDVEAAVTLPTDGSGSAPNIVAAIGNVTDVAVSNVANWYQSAVHFDALPTIGVAHTDLEQALSHKWHMFSTGTEPHSPVRKGIMTIPFLDIVKFKSLMASKVPGVTFNVSDETNNRSGYKVGLFGSNVTITQDLQNKYSLLTSLDGGYSNLYYNFAAPFMFTRSFPALRTKVVPDLFGNYVPFGAGALDAAATDAGGNDFGLSSTARTDQIDGAVTANADHVVGRVVNIYDIPNRALLHLAANPVFQSRIIGDATERNWTNEGYRRVRGADTGGVEAILSDFLLMLLGGANYTWASGILPSFGGIGQDVAVVLETLVVEGAAGLVEIALNLVD